jgi:hypothetical protein
VTGATWEGVKRVDEGLRGLGRGVIKRNTGSGSAASKGQNDMSSDAEREEF